MRRLAGVLVGATALTAVVLGGTAAMASNTAAAVSPAACTGTIQVNSFMFVPPTVNAGAASTATLVLQNCTSTTQTVYGIWAPRYAASDGTGIPAGCPAIDPVAQQANLAPNGTLTQTFGYFTFSGCTATGLDATVNLSIGGTRVATATAHLTIVQPTATTPPPPPSTCRVHYAKNEWPGGFTANLTVTNTGTTAINNWTLVFTFPGDQKISNGWNGVVHQVGQTVTITNEPYNATISPGASASLGFQGTWTTNDASPTAFTLNGGPCAVV